MWSWCSSIMKRATKSSGSKQVSAYPQESSLEYRERTFYIFFTSSSKYIWTPFLKKNFHHCYVIEKLDLVWCLVDPTRIGLNIIFPNCPLDHPLIENMMLLSPDSRVLEVVTKGQVNSFLLRPKLLSCVSVVQYITGISFGLCITPYSLFKNLLKCKDTNLVFIREIER